MCVCARNEIVFRVLFISHIVIRIGGTSKRVRRFPVRGNKYPKTERGVSRAVN